MRRPPRLMPAAITPFTADGEVDLDAHAANVATLVERGIEGFLIGGSTGEGPYLETGERHRLIATTRAADPGTYVMGGVSAESLRGAVAQANEAAEGGADAVLVITPTSLVRGNDTLVARFCNDIADGSPLPVLLYSVPKVTGYELPVTTVLDLRDHPNVIGMKDSGGQPVRVHPLTAGESSRFDVYSGSTPALMLSVAAGARGGITASSNYAGALARQVIEAAMSSPAEARSAQHRLTTLASVVEQHGIGGVKAAAALTGLDAGHLRRPLLAVPPAVDDAIRAALEAAAII